MDVQMLNSRAGVPVAPRPFARCQKPVPIAAVPQVATSFGSQLPRRRPVFSSRSHTVVAPAAASQPVVWAGPAVAEGTDNAPKLGEWGYGSPEELRKAFSWGGKKEIGSGSYGEVFDCIDIHTGELLAIKVLSKALTEDQSIKAKEKAERQKRALSDVVAEVLQRTKTRVAKEVKALKALKMDTVVGFRGAFEDKEKVYIVLERMYGGDLNAALEAVRPERSPVVARDGYLPEAAVARIIYECLKLCEEIHHRDFVHLDIKPANFMLSAPIPDFVNSLSEGDLPAGWFKAIDFGCSEKIPEDGLIKVAKGTPLYMAPEAWEKKCGKEADLWSVGMMMYQLVADRFPFWDKSRPRTSYTQEEVKKAITDRERVIPLNYGPWERFSEEGKGLLKALLTRDRHLRITASEALDHRWFKNQPWYKYVANSRPVTIYKSNILPCSSLHSAGPDPKWFSPHDTVEEGVY